MRLYPRREGTASVVHGGVTYAAGPSGGFDFPDHVSDVLHPFAVRGERLWESDIERQHRTTQEEMARVRDPATLYEAVAKIVAAAEGRPEPAKPARAKAAAAK